MDVTNAQQQFDLLTDHPEYAVAWAFTFGPILLSALAEKDRKLAESEARLKRAEGVEAAAMRYIEAHSAREATCSDRPSPEENQAYGELCCHLTVLGYKSVIAAGTWEGDRNGEA